VSFSSTLDQLIDALRALPGVGPKSAQRMALHLLDRDRDGGRFLAQTLARAMDEVRECKRCRMLSDTEICRFCSDSKRSGETICVLESAGDVFAVEQTGYRGAYFVLKGHLSPIDGIGPESLGVDRLLEWARSPDVSEIILATNATVEGEATAHYLSEQLKATGVNITRIAHGVPLGGELEYVDGNTLAHAFAGRKSVT
jgi:recombination protein RecR